MTTIYLIRHGRTDWVGRRITGNLPGVHLNDTGRLQASQAAGYLSQYPIQAIFSSPMERTMETASFLGITKEITVTPKEFLREINFGSLQGLTGDELDKLAIWKQFLAHPGTVKFPGGESVLEAQERIVSGFNELSSQYPQESQIACFSHCEILRLAIAAVLNMPLDDFIKLTVNPASISCIEWGETRTLKWLNFQPSERITPAG